MDFEALGRTFSPRIVTLRLFFIIVVLLFIFSPADCQSQVIGLPQFIFAAPGDDVILQCYLEPPFNVEGLTVEWSKPDLKPDPSDPLRRVNYVHLYRDRREIMDMKLLSYIRRTELFTDDLKHGNISLKILNVTVADTGRYRCFIPKLNSQVKHSIVELVVDSNFVKTPTSETTLHSRNHETADPEDMMDVKGGRSRLSILIPVMVFGILLTILIGGVTLYFFTRRHKKQDFRDLEQQDPKLQGEKLDQQKSGLLDGIRLPSKSCREKDLT